MGIQISISNTHSTAKIQNKQVARESCHNARLTYGNKKGCWAKILVTANPNPTAILSHHKIFFILYLLATHSKINTMRFITAIALVEIAIDSCSAFTPSVTTRLAASSKGTSLRMADGDDDGVMNKYSR